MDFGPSAIGLRVELAQHLGGLAPPLLHGGEELRHVFLVRQFLGDTLLVAQVLGQFPGRITKDVPGDMISQATITLELFLVE